MCHTNWKTGKCWKNLGWEGLKVLETGWRLLGFVKGKVFSLLRVPCYSDRGITVKGGSLYLSNLSSGSTVEGTGQSRGHLDRRRGKEGVWKGKSSKFGPRPHSKAVSLGPPWRTSEH